MPIFLSKIYFSHINYPSLVILPGQNDCVAKFNWILIEKGHIIISKVSDESKQSKKFENITRNVF